MKVIYFLVLYYLFHEFFLKLSGLTGAPLFVLRQWPDILIVGIYLSFLVKSIALGRTSVRHLTQDS